MSDSSQKTQDECGETIRDLWRAAQCVCFDVDSTVSPEEGIDVLAGFAGKGEAVAELTRNAMGGSVRFEDALRARLDLIRPSRQMLEDCLRAHPPRLNAGIDALIRRLQSRGTHIHLVSGGFVPMIRPLADQLGIPAVNIHANVLTFQDDGRYLGFDADQPTSRSGGKARVVARLKQQFNYYPVIMIGDGATDMEARPPADAFIGYGGVVEREAVKAGADWYVTDFADLVAALDGA
jgi:phosphoserine phosphatase